MKLTKYGIVAILMVFYLVVGFYLTTKTSSPMQVNNLIKPHIKRHRALEELGYDFQNGNTHPLIALPHAPDATNAVVLLLANSRHSVLEYNGISEKRIIILHNCLINFDRVYNSAYGPYPLVVFHEDFTIDDELYLTAMLSNRTVVTFLRVNFNAYPGNITRGMIENWSNGGDGSVAGRGPGYRMMCRFWSGIVQNHPSLDRFDYYLRLDDDTRFDGTPPQDFFSLAESKQIKYIFRVNMHDSWGGNQLHQVFERYIDQYPADVNGTLDMDALKQVQSHQQHPYTNFHVSSFDFWRTREFLRFFQMCDKDQLFMKYRVGDTTFISYPMFMYLKKEEMMMLTDFTYHHNFHKFQAGSTRLEFRLNRDFIDMK